MQLKKWIALCMAALMLLSLAACSTEKPGEQTGDAGTATPAETTAAPADTEPLTEFERRALLDDGLPKDKVYDNKDFVYLPQTSVGYVKEDYNGEAVNDATLDRNRAVESRFGVKITQTELTSNRNQFTAYIEQLNAAGDADAYHVVSANMIMNGAPAIAGSYLNWFEIPYVDLSKEWWPASNLDCLTVDGQAYMIISDAALASVGGVSAMYYDKVLAEAYNLPDMYDVVSQGKWTYDTLLEYTSSVYDDLNRNGARDKEDFFGLVSGMQSNLNVYLWSFGNQIYTRQADDTFAYTFYTDRTVDTFEKVVSMFNNYDGIYGEIPHNFGSEMFSQGKALFANGHLSHSIVFFGDMQNPYGIIPYPKLDEEQKNYASMVDGGAHSISVPVIAEELDFIGLITEAMAAETYKKILPVYLDQTLKLRYSDSPKDAEMVDLILDTRVFDIGYIYDNWQGVSFYLEILTRANSTDLASHYSANKDLALAHYSKVFSLFDGK